MQTGYYSPLTAQYGGWKPPQQPQGTTQKPPTGQTPPQGPAQPQTPPAGHGGASSQTFAQMQRQGQARPPAPAWTAAQQPSYGTQLAPNNGIVAPPAQQAPSTQQPSSGMRPQLYAPGVTSGSTTAVGPGAPAGTPSPNPFSAQTSNPANPSGITQYGGYYGSALPASQQQQDMGNSMGTAVQNLLLGGLAQAPYMGQGLAYTQQGGLTNAAAGLASQQAANPTPYANSPLATGAQQAIQGQLANPNPYNSQNIQQMMQVLQQPILEQEQQAIQGTQANMAARGLYDSTLAQGNLQDIYTQAGRQQADIGAQLLQQAANAQLAGENSAIGNASGLQGQLANQYLQGVNSAIGNTSGLAGQEFGQQQTATNNAINNLLGYSGQNFNQNYQTAQLNDENQALYNQQVLQLLGLS